MSETNLSRRVKAFKDKYGPAVETVVNALPLLQYENLPPVQYETRATFTRYDDDVVRSLDRVPLADRYDDRRSSNETINNAVRRLKEVYESIDAQHPQYASAEWISHDMKPFWIEIRKKRDEENRTPSQGPRHSKVRQLDDVYRAAEKLANYFDGEEYKKLVKDVQAYRKTLDDNRERTTNNPERSFRDLIKERRGAAKSLS